MMEKIIKKYKYIFLFLLLSCGSEDGTFLLENQDAINNGDRYLYVASGACYGGGVTLSTGIGTISRYNLSTGERLGTVFNYTLNGSANDLPSGLINYSSSHLMVGIENTARRVDLLRKDGQGINVFTQNATILAAPLRGIFPSQDGGFFIPRNTAVEKVSASGTRITIGAATAFIASPAAPCATSTTLMMGGVELPGGKILYIHAAATANNKFGLISSTGYAAAPDCLAAQVAPTTTALPTAIVRHSSGKILVAYGSTTSTSNFIYSYDVNETANTITNATLAYYNTSALNGPSSMVEDTVTGDVFVSSATIGLERIERFTYNSNGTLTRVGSSPFISNSEYVRCVSGMVIAN